MTETSSFPVTLCHQPLPVDRGKTHVVTELIAECGHPVQQVEDGDLELDPRGVVWLQGNSLRFPNIVAQLRQTPPERRPLVLHWFSEPLPPPAAAGLPRPRLYWREWAKIVLRDARATDVYSNHWRLRSLTRAGLLDLLIASTHSRCEYLAERGISAEWAPLGFHSKLHGDLEQRERDVEVLFLGLVVPRRRRLLNQLQAAGIEVLSQGSWHDPKMWGDSRTELLNRTQIFLNLSRHAGELAGLRLVLGMSHQVLVVSEPMYRPEPFVPGEHYVSCAMEEMPATIRYYLDHPEEARRIAEAGYRLVTEQITMKGSVERILGLIARRRDSYRQPG